MLRLAAITLAALLLMPGLASADPNQSFEQCQRGRTDDNGGWDCENKEDECDDAGGIFRAKGDYYGGGGNCFSAGCGPDNLEKCAPADRGHACLLARWQHCCRVAAPAPCAAPRCCWKCRRHDTHRLLNPCLALFSGTFEFQCGPCSCLTPETCKAAGGAFFCPCGSAADITPCTDQKDAVWKPAWNAQVPHEGTCITKGPSKSCGESCPSPFVGTKNRHGKQSDVAKYGFTTHPMCDEKKECITSIPWRGAYKTMAFEMTPEEAMASPWMGEYYPREDGLFRPFPCQPSAHWVTTSTTETTTTTTQTTTTTPLPFYFAPNTGPLNTDQTPATCAFTGALAARDRHAIGASVIPACPLSRHWPVQEFAVYRFPSRSI